MILPLFLHQLHPKLFNNLHPNLHLNAKLDLPLKLTKKSNCLILPPMHSPQKMIPIIMMTFPLLLRQLHPNNLHPNLHPDQNAKLDLLLKRTKKLNWPILPPMHSLQKMILIKKKNLANRTPIPNYKKKKIKKIKKIILYILCFKLTLLLILYIYILLSLLY